MSDPFDDIKQEFATLRLENESLRESIVSNMIAIEDVGWAQIIGGDPTNVGPNLDILHRLTIDLRDMAATNPLHVRGAELRCGYVFGCGVNYNNVKPKAQSLIDDPYNKSAVFGIDAQTAANLATFTDGNYFVVRDTKTNELTVVPLSQITGVVTHEQDPQRIHYLRRTWSTNGVNYTMWYPLARYARTKRNIPASIAADASQTPVNQHAVIYHRHTKRQAGWTFGIPDSLAAKIWTLLYTGYLKDDAKLVKALSQIAWAVSSKTKAGADSAAAKVMIPGVAGTAVVGDGTNLSAMSRGADVNFNNGQPLAAMVATSFGVPVIALLSSPGASGGSYGAATTLDEPTLKVMMAEQTAWKDFYEEILLDFGSKDATADFPAISSDATYRQAASLTLAHASGAIFQDEYRSEMVNLLDVHKFHAETDLPKPNGFNTYTDPKAQAKAAAAVANPVAAQGNTGAVPGGTSQGVTDHSGDTKN